MGVFMYLCRNKDRKHGLTAEMINMEILRQLDGLQPQGLIIGLATFLIIGIFHPLVIKGYYYFGLRCRWWFAVAGVLFCAASLLISQLTVSIIFGVVAFSCFWSIGEVTQQAERVRKGWFPAGPGAEKDARKKT